MSGFDALLSALREQVDVIAATALLYRQDGAERIFSTHPELFPDTGFKSYAQAPKMAQVRQVETAQVTEGRTALEQGFADWRVIVSTGSDAIVNLPVRDAGGRVLGQLNLMGRSGSFSKDKLARLREIASAHAAVFDDPNEYEVETCV